MTISFLASGTNVTANSLEIPVADLSGFASLADFQDVAANKNLLRFFVGFMNESYKVMSPTNFLKLGIGLAKTITNPTPASPSIFNLNYATTLQYYIEADTTPQPLPLPTTGENFALGDFDLITLFPGAKKTATGAPTTVDAVVIPVSDIEPYGSPAYASINLAAGQDNRNIWMALVRYLADSLPVRAAAAGETPAVVSALISKSLPAPTIPTLPAAYTASPNPLTGIDPSLLYGQASVQQQTFNLSVEMVLDSDTLTANVSHV